MADENVVIKMDYEQVADAIGKLRKLATEVRELVVNEKREEGEVGIVYEQMLLIDKKFEVSKENMAKLMEHTAMFLSNTMDHVKKTDENTADQYMKSNG